jgi:hypothetical protein
VTNIPSINLILTKKSRVDRSSVSAGRTLPPLACPETTPNPDPFSVDGAALILVSTSLEASAFASAAALASAAAFSSKRA